MDVFLHKLPLSYKLNPANIKKFISASDISVREIVKKVVRATTHISYEKFVILLNKNLRDIIRKGYIKKNVMHIFIPSYFEKDKSNYWIIEYIQFFMKKNYSHISINILYENEHLYNIDDKDTVFIVDDCVYSGDQMSSLISSLGLDGYSLKLTFYIFVSFMSQYGLQNVMYSFTFNPSLSDCDHILPKYIYDIKPITHYISMQDLAKLYKYYGYNLRPTQIKYLYPIYFDHKLADTLSTLTEFYSGVVPNDHNKEIFMGYGDLSNLILYPIISNCDKVKIQSLGYFMHPKCPSPPYKKDFSEFLKSVVDRKKLYHKSPILNQKATSSATRRQKNFASDNARKIPKTVKPNTYGRSHLSNVGTLKSKSNSIFKASKYSGQTNKNKRNKSSGNSGNSGYTKKQATWQDQ